MFTNKPLLGQIGAGLAALLLAPPLAFANPLLDIEADMPSVMQDQVCGDLLAGMSIAGLKELGSQGVDRNEVVSDDRLKLVYHTGALAILLMENARPELSDEGIAHARKIALEVEARDAMSHVGVVRYCAENIQERLGTHEFHPEVYEQAVLKAYNTLPLLGGGGE